MSDAAAQQEASTLYRTFRSAEIALQISYNEANFYAEADALAGLQGHLERNDLTGTVFDPFTRPLKKKAAASA